MYWLIVVVVLIVIHGAMVYLSSPVLELTPTQVLKQKEFTQKVKDFRMEECTKLFKQVETPDSPVEIKIT